MKREKIIELFNEYVEARNRVNAYYITYKETENATSQKWGKLKTADELNAVIDDVEKSSLCIQGELPIVRLMIYSDDQCMAIIENPLWDCVNDESEDSHVVMTVPFISRDGWFGTVKDWVNNRFGITNEDMTGSLNGFPVGVVTKLLELQMSQNGKEDICVFQKDACSDKNEGGFLWKETEEGDEFWGEVIDERNFELFFGRFPEYRRYNF